MLLILGCSTVLVKNELPKDFSPPTHLSPTINDTTKLDAYYNEIIAKHSNNQSVLWWAQYKKAQHLSNQDPESSCDLFHKLSQINFFPLQDIAFLRAHEICSKVEIRKDLAPLSIENFSDEPWLNEILMELSLSLARTQNKKDELKDLLIEKSKRSLIQNEKVNLTREALFLAEELNDKTSVNEYTKRLYKLAPRLNPTQDENQWLDIAYDHRRNRNFKQALYFYQNVIDSSQSDVSKKYKGYLGLRKTYKLMNNKPLYLSTTQNLADYSKKRYSLLPKSSLARDIYYKYQIMLMRSLWTMGQVSNALTVLSHLDRDLPKHYSRHEIYWLQGRIAEEQSRFKDAADLFKKALSQIQNKKNSLKEKIAWYYAWNLRKIGEYNDALPILEELEIELKKQSEYSIDSHKYSFWKNRTLLDLGRIEDGQEGFKSLIEEDIFGYYGLLAYRELKQPLPSRFKSDRQLASVKSPKAVRILTPSNINYLNWLIHVNEHQISGKFLNFLSSQLIDNNIKDKNTWIELFSYYQKANHNIDLVKHLYRFDEETRKEFYLTEPSILFPQPFKNSVLEASNKYQISPNIIYAIMRQESGFNPLARSHADAFGLMQILPRVAEKIAQEFSIPLSDSSDLYNPHTNIFLGTAYLNKAFKNYNNQFILSVASYNAADSAIRGWVKTRHSDDPLVFIEDIPYEETQKYIKLVMRNMIYYQRINSPHQAIDFPEWCLIQNSENQTEDLDSEPTQAKL